MAIVAVVLAAAAVVRAVAAAAAIFAGPRQLPLCSTGDTIAAVSTPPGRGGIGIVRISGPDARTIARACSAISGRATPARGNRGPRRWPSLPDADGHAVDQVVVTYFAAPRSYTAEDVIEIACHGSPGGPALCAGASLPRRRAAGRAGRVYAARVPQWPHRSAASRSDSRSDRRHHAVPGSHRRAASGGSVSRRLKPVKEQLLELIALLEAGIDFAEDDISVAPAGRDPAAARSDHRGRSRRWPPASPTASWCTTDSRWPSWGARTSARAASSIGCWSRTGPS